LIEEPELKQLDTELKAIEALRLVIAGEANALFRTERVVDSRSPHKTGIDTAIDIALVRKI
tara:strand:+ start:1021 stop:1203 length:183 start_codon:yes stop_codon:yes gene_type:complete